VNSDVLSDIQEAMDPVQRVKVWLIRQWRKEAASLVDKMLQDRKEAERQLKHPDWTVRCTALSILEHHWEAASDADFAQRCEELGLRDIHPQVRSNALRSLGVCYENTNDLRIGTLLAQVVLDEMQAPEARRGAYLGLYHVRGRCFQWPRDLNDPPTVLRIPEDIDWSFVKSFCRG